MRRTITGNVIFSGPNGVESAPARSLGAIRPELDSDHYRCTRCGVVKPTKPDRKKPNMTCKDCTSVELLIRKIEAGEVELDDDEEEDSCLAGVA